MASNRLIILIFIILLIPSLTGAQTTTKEDVVAVGFSTLNTLNSVPAGWGLDRKKGKAHLRMVKEGATSFLNMVCKQSAFGIEKAVKVNVKEYPFLNWTWKAVKLPQGGDVRSQETDDQAIQIYLAFTATGFPAQLNTPVLSYIWDNEAPKEWTGRSPQIGGSKFRYLVMRNKTDRLNEWSTEKRNVYQDYQKLFSDLQGGESPGPIEGISLYINTHHTGSLAESHIGNIYFSRQ